MEVLGFGFVADHFDVVPVRTNDEFDLPRLQPAIYLCLPQRQFAGKHCRRSTAIPKHNPLPQKSCKNYMSDKSGLLCCSETTHHSSRIPDCKSMPKYLRSASWLPSGEMWTVLLTLS